MGPSECNVSRYNLDDMHAECLQTKVWFACLEPIITIWRSTQFSSKQYFIGSAIPHNSSQTSEFVAHIDDMCTLSLSLLTSDAS